MPNAGLLSPQDALLAIEKLEPLLAASYLSTSQFRKALPILEEHYQQHPDDPASVFNLALCLRDLGLRDRSLGLAAEAYRLMPAIAGLNFAEELLWAGDWQRGWDLFNQHRHTKRAAAEAAGLAALPEWDGTVGHRVAVLDEGGLGDAVCYSRWLDRMPCEYGVVSNPQMEWLGRPNPKLNFDCWTTIFSLPGLLGGFPPPLQLPISDRPGTGIGLCWNATEYWMRGKKTK